MRFNLIINTRFTQKALAFAVATTVFQFTHADARQDEIQQLRAEVQELRALIQQQAAQNRVAPAAPTAITAPPPVTVQGTQLTTAKGAKAKLYGFVRGDANYILEGSDSDFNGVAASTGAAQDKLRATMQTTRVGVDFSTPLANGKELGGKIEADFAGGTNNDNLRIRHAYLTYENWLFGQTTSNFLANHAPEMLDFSTNLGGGTTRLPQVRYGLDVAPATKLLVSLEEGDSSVTDGNTIKYKLPVLTAKLTQGFAGDAGQASLRALVEQYDVNAKAGNSSGEDKTAWGVAAGANYQILPALKLTADYSHVKGDSKYLYGSNAGATVVNNKVLQNEFDAIQVGATYQFTPKIRSTLGYGAIFADDSNAYAKSFASTDTSKNANKELRQIWLNLVYSPVKPLEFGLEYIDGERETFGGTKLNDNRVGLMAKYSF